MFDMVFNSRSDELIVAGCDGLKVYYTEPDKLAYARSPKDPDEVLRYLAGMPSPIQTAACAACVVHNSDCQDVSKKNHALQWLVYVNVWSSASVFKIK